MDALSASFLQDTLRPYTPVVPPVWNPYADLDAGFSVANQLDKSAAAGQSYDQTANTLAMQPAQNAATLANLASTQQLRQAQADQATAHAGLFQSRAQQVSKPFNPPPFDAYGTGAGSSGVAAPPAPTTTLVDGSTPPPPSNEDDDTDDPSSDSTPIIGLSTGTDSPTAANGAGAFMSKATGYHPVPPSDPNFKMEGGFDDRMGNPIYTLDDYRAGRAPYVTVAADPKAFDYGTTLSSPDFPGVPFKTNDTGSAFTGKGTTRIDIARSTAAGANADENNGNITFNRGAPSIPAPPADDSSNVAQDSITPDVPSVNIDGEDMPLAAVNNAFPSQTTNDGAGGATVPANAPSGGTGSFRMPTNDAEATLIRNNYNAYAQANRGNPDPRMKAYLDGMRRDLAATLAQYNTNRALQARAQLQAGRAPTPSPLTATDPSTGLPVVPGHFPSNIRVVGGKLNYDQQSPNDIADEQQQALVRNTQNAEAIVKAQTGGATISDLLNDRGDWRVAPGLTPGIAPGTTTGSPQSGGAHVPGMNFFIRTDPKTGEQTEQGMTAAQYQDLRDMVTALHRPGGSGGPSIPTPPGTTSASAPTLPGVAPVPPGPLPNLALSLGPNALLQTNDPGSFPTAPAVPASTGGAVPAPASGSSKLDAAAASVVPGTDAERAAADAVAQDRARQASAGTEAATRVQADANAANDTKMLAYQMNAHLTPIDRRISDLNQQLQSEQDASANGFQAAGSGQSFAARAIQRLRQQRAAILDKTNYKPLPGGGFQYVDPYDQSLLPTAVPPIPTSAGNVTVTRSQ